MYELIFDTKAIDALNKLPKNVKERIFKKLISVKSNPHYFFERLEGRQDYKLRVGDYRIIADITRKEKRIEITHIGHRRNIYS